MRRSATLLPGEASQSTFTLTQCKELSRLLTDLHDRYRHSVRYRNIDLGSVEGAGSMTRAISPAEDRGKIAEHGHNPQEASPFSHAVLVLTIAGVLVKKCRSIQAASTLSSKD